MNWARRLDTWQRSKTGLLITTIIALALAYVFTSLAIDSGSLLDYAIALLLLASALQSIYGLWKYRGHQHD